MPVRAKFQIDGLRELEARARALPEGVGGNQLRSAVRAGMAKPVKEKAEQLAPRDTGRLANAIDMRIIGTKSRDAAIRQGNAREGYYVGVKRGKSRDDQDGAWYYWFVENGTEKMPAQPFLRPALNAQAPKLIASFKREFDRILTLAEKRARRLGLYKK